MYEGVIFPHHNMYLSLYIYKHTSPQKQTYIYIIIIIMSCRPHGYPGPSLATFPYRSLPPAGLLNYIPYLHIAAVCMFELVVLILLGHMCFNQAGDISTLDGTSLKLVDKFAHLGSSISSTEKDIYTRLTKAWTAIDKLSII